MDCPECRTCTLNTCQSSPEHSGDESYKEKEQAMSTLHRHSTKVQVDTYIHTVHVRMHTAGLAR